MITIKPLNPATLNNPDTGEKTLFIDIADDKIKTKDSEGNIGELAVVDEDAPVVLTPLIFKGIITQTTTNAPTLIYTQANTTGFTPVFTRSTAGLYNMSFIGLFAPGTNFGKVHIQTTFASSGAEPKIINASQNGGGSTDTITFYIYKASTATPTLIDLQGQLFISLEVYP